jgi:two-component system, OmpR family, sensor histidine kinase BaeS
MKHEPYTCDPPQGWPPGEPWPPSKSYMPHGRGYVVRRKIFFRRFAAVAVVLVVLAVWGLLALAWITATRLGLVDTSTPTMPLLLVAGWFAGLAVIAFLRVGRRFGFPLRAVMEAADRVADGDYSVRVGLHGPPPIRALAHAFNTMTERLERNDLQRRNMMADVAHELRTPLTVIQGRVEGLLDGVYPRDDAGLGLVLEETRVLSRLIDDLRTLALSEAGALKLEKEATDVAALARDVAEAFAADARAGQISISIDVRGEVSAAIDVDPVRIREVLTNLVSNALRHTGAGGAVTIAVSRADRHALSVAVTDTGAGMTADEAARVFGRFYKGSESRGSGLGLAIAKGLVAAHGGSIGVNSEPGRGTTITFTLPAD